MTILSMKDLDLNHKRVLIRVDLNVPMKAGKVSNDARLRAVLPTIQQAVLANARILLLSHLGRPIEGDYQEAYSLKPVAKHLSELLGRPVRFVKDWLEGIDIAPQEIVLGENVRFNIGEESCDSLLSKRIAALCDVFIMDAFASAHRSQASTVGVAQFAPVVAAGPLLTAELDALAKAIHSPKRPLVAIVGGAKASEKILLLKSLLEKVDTLIIGGGIANTFIAALGYSAGASLYEPNLISLAQELLAFAKKRNNVVLVPIDVIVAGEISENAQKRITSLDDIADHERILDVGPKTSEQYCQILKDAGTILWNGPLGVFELDAFAEGTKQLANAIAASNAFSVAGGGETLAAIEKYHVAPKISYISTGGGAFLEYIEGKTLPAVKVLEERSKGFFN